jgi:DNA repair protein RadB
MNGRRLPFGVETLDALLEGGVEAGSLTQLYGEGGSGKTNLCLALCVEAAREGRWTIYLDTEGLSLARLDQMARGKGTTLPAVLHRLLLTTPRTLEEQERAVERACALASQRDRQVGLLVLDSATLLYRLDLGREQEGLSRQSLTQQMADLLHTAVELQVPVVFTNQVFRNPETRELEPIGGSFLQHATKTLIRLDRGQDGWRRAVLLKHRSLPEGGMAEFRLTDRGLGTS